jgi:hypothetical protein
MPPIPPNRDGKKKNNGIGGGGSFGGRGASGSWADTPSTTTPTTTTVPPKTTPPVVRPTVTIPDFTGWTPDAKTAYVTYGTDLSGLRDQQYGVTRDWIGGRKTDFQNAIAKQRAEVMKQYSTEPDPMIRAMLKRRVADLDARLAAAVPSIAASYKPAIDSAQTASQTALITGRQYGDELRDSYLNTAAQNNTRSLDASAALAGALGGQVAAGNTSAATRDFGEFMQGMAPIQQKAAMDYGQMLSALMQTDANSSTRQQGADQAYARNLTSQLAAQAQEEAAQREYEQVQRAREMRAQALSELAARELQGNMSFDQQLAEAMQSRDAAALQAEADRNALLQGYRLEDIQKSDKRATAAQAQVPAIADTLVPRTGNPISLGVDSNGQQVQVDRSRIRSAVELAYAAAMNADIPQAQRWATFVNALYSSGIPEQALVKGNALSFGAQAFGVV